MKFVVEKGNFPTDAKVSKNYRIDIDTISFKNPVICLNSFDNSKPIGLANLSIENGILYAEMENIPEVYNGYYPAIGVKTYKLKNKDVIENSTVFAISLNLMPNADQSIEPIKI